jgi:hypothetical protein
MQPFAAAISPLMSLLQNDQRGHVSPYRAVCEVAAHSHLRLLVDVAMPSLACPILLCGLSCFLEQGLDCLNRAMLLFKLSNHTTTTLVPRISFLFYHAIFPEI